MPNVPHDPADDDRPHVAGTQIGNALLGAATALVLDVGHDAAVVGCAFVAAAAKFAATIGVSRETFDHTVDIYLPRGLESHGQRRG